MQRLRLISTAALALIAVACGQPTTTGTAQAQPATTSASTASTATAGAATSAEKAAILQAMHLTANARGLVMNECGDRVEPQYIPTDVGLGRTILFVMIGGPNGGYTCYGDGPGLWLLQAQGAAFHSIYDSRGGFLVIMPSKHHGANDLVFGGPGMTHSSMIWNGSAYVAGPDVSDDAVGKGVMLPAS